MTSGSNTTQARITPGSIKQALDPAVSPHGAYADFIASLSLNGERAVYCSIHLLKAAEQICSTADQGRLSGLVRAVVNVCGVGRGVYFAAINHLSEQQARLVVRTWLFDGYLEAVSEADMHVGIHNASSMGRYKLAYDLIKTCGCHYGEASAALAISGLSAPEIAAGNFLNVELRPLVVRALCSVKRYSSAIDLCSGDDALEELVRKAIAAQIGVYGTQQGDWMSLGRKMAQRIKGPPCEKSAQDAFRGAAYVVFDKIRSMSDEAVSSFVRNDRDRLIAFQLGLDSVAADMSGSTRAEALMFSFNI